MTIDYSPLRFDWTGDEFATIEAGKTLERHMIDIMLLCPDEVTVSFNRKTLTFSVDDAVYSIPGKLRQFI